MADTNGRSGKKKQSKVSDDRAMSEQSKFSPEAQAAVIKAAGQGMTKELCAAMAGVSSKTLRRWELRGMEDPDGPVHDFVTEWHLAHAKFLSAHLMNVTRAAVGTPATVGKNGKVVPAIEGDWRASIELLARIRPDQFARRIVEVSGHKGGPIEHEHTIDLSELTDEQLGIMASVDFVPESDS